MRTVRLAAGSVALTVVLVAFSTGAGHQRFAGTRDRPREVAVSLSSQVSLTGRPTRMASLDAPSRFPTPTPTPPQPVAAITRILFTGNIFWGRYIDDWSRASDLGTSYPFSRLDEFDRDAYDAWISGLECPAVEGLDLSSARQDADLSFNCLPEYLPEAASWFTALSLANNHTDNQGADGFEETKRHLREAGIQYFGHHDPNVLDEVCGLVIVPATATYDDGSAGAGHLPFAMCGYHGVFQVPSAESLDLISRYSQYVPVIAMPHMGAEYTATPDQIKTDTYRAMIDRGATVVLGDHPHWVQSAEEYGGKLIVYSMGNFMFDQQYNHEVTRSAAVDVTFAVTDGGDVEGWLDLASEPIDGLDDLVAEAERRGLSRLVVEGQYSIRGTRDDGRLVHPADAEEQSAIEDRLGWAALAGQFG
jgi:poly-gamma-glutamate synthesis protein (capsule biosynthesis protein)